MQVEVKLFALFRDHLPPKSGPYSCKLELPEGTTIAQVLRDLKIPESIPAITLVNGVHRRMDEALQAGDVLSVFPPVAGG
ncbi:MAG: MoaD/ThiS family protein [Deltaproteobacteria bacterium]|nr:MoaD/ThiS family protein [Deltaproteobacteria bacterium]